jgi:hypothetical protein
LLLIPFQDQAFSKSRKTDDHQINCFDSLKWFGTKSFAFEKSFIQMPQENFSFSKNGKIAFVIQFSVKSNLGRTETVITLTSRELLFDVGFFRKPSPISTNGPQGKQ